MIKVLRKKMLTLPEVEKLLREKAKNTELSSTEQLTLDYVSKVSKIKAEGAVKLFEKLLEFGVKEETAVQIINILPDNEEELRIILIPEGKFYSHEELRSMLELIEKIRKEYGKK
ncbi:MAG: hypothetical protein DRJ47_03050 [Thermoprotei archaeon]|nr:MAG: hypothetical protein DRJ47_03050 [Thermoprotei archaeon]